MIAVLCCNSLKETLHGFDQSRVELSIIAPPATTEQRRNIEEGKFLLFKCEVNI